MNVLGNYLFFVCVSAYPFLFNIWLFSSQYKRFHIFDQVGKSQVHKKPKKSVVQEK